MKRLFSTILLVILVISLFSCSSELTWPSSDLGKVLPEMDGVKGTISEYVDSLRITLEEITQKQYDDYITSCMSKGFTIDVKQDATSYFAYNEDGYKLDISFFSNGDMWISCHAPIQMSEFQWPTTYIAQLLPVPKSTFGNLNWSENYGFVVYIGNTTIDDYKDYVEIVKNSGFAVDVNSGDDFYYADNTDGYSVMLKHEGFNTMFIRIDAPESDNNSNEDTSVENASSADEFSEESSGSSSPTQNPSTDSNSSETENSSEQEHITIENNQDFAILLSLKDPSDPIISDFASKYAGQTIKFDGCILAMNNHGNYKTRYDILIGAGDYDETSSRGPNFRLTDVNSTDMKLGTLYPEDIISVGKNVVIVAKVGKYNSDSTIFELEIISVVIK